MHVVDILTLDNEASATEDQPADVAEWNATDSSMDDAEERLLLSEAPASNSQDVLALPNLRLASDSHKIIMDQRDATHPGSIKATSSSHSSQSSQPSLQPARSLVRLSSRFAASDDAESHHPYAEELEQKSNRRSEGLPLLQQLLGSDAADIGMANASQQAAGDEEEEETEDLRPTHSTGSRTAQRFVQESMDASEELAVIMAHSRNVKRELKVSFNSRHDSHLGLGDAGKSHSMPQFVRTPSMFAADSDGDDSHGAMSAKRVRGGAQGMYRSMSGVGLQRPGGSKDKHWRLSATASRGEHAVGLSPLSPHSPKRSRLAKWLEGEGLLPTFLRSPKVAARDKPSSLAWAPDTRAASYDPNKMQWAPTWLRHMMSGPSITKRHRSILMMRSPMSDGSMSMGRLRRPSMSMLTRRKKNVHWDVADDGLRPERMSGWQRFWRMFEPDSPLMTTWDDWRALLCLYETWALPLRMALGTAYTVLKEHTCLTATINHSAQVGWLWLDVTIDVMFFIDIVLMVLAAITMDKYEKAVVAETARVQLEAGDSSPKRSALHPHRPHSPANRPQPPQGTRARLLKQAPSGGSTVSTAAQRVASVSVLARTHEDRSWGHILASVGHVGLRKRPIGFLNRMRTWRENRLGCQPFAASVQEFLAQRKHMAAYALRSLLFDLAACFCMYLPLIRGWSIWTWWLMQVTRLPRIQKLYLYFRSRELMIHINIRHIAFGKFVVLVLGVAHWIGCIFYFMSRTSGYNQDPLSATWVEQVYANSDFNYGCDSNASIMQVYGVAIYKGLNGLANLGYDIDLPQRSNEMLFAALVMLISAVMEAYILGTLFHYVIKKDAKLWAFRQLLRAVQAYCKTRNLPASLEERLLQYFEFQHTKMLDSDGSRILRALPETLRMKIASHQYNYVIERNSLLFKGCNLQFLNQLMIKLRETYLMPGEVMIREGDMARELGFVAQGVVEEIRDGAVIRSMRHDSEHSNAVGDVAFFMGIPQPRAFQARTTADVTLLVISKLDYEEVVQNYPEQNDIIVTNILTYYELDKDGNDLSINKEGGEAVSEDAKEKLRNKRLIQAAVQKRNSEALSAMTFAAILGDVDTMRSLLQRGLPINTKDYDGRTTLHLAALEGNAKVLEVLLNEGADPMVRDRWGHTPLQHAVAKRHGPVIELLQRFNAKLGYEDASRHLCAAADAGDMRQLTRLIENGVDPNVRDYDQRTACHIAAKKGLLKVVEYLVSCKAEINAVDRWGSTPLRVAVLGGHELVASLIRSKGGRLEMQNAARALGQAANEGDLKTIRLLVDNGVAVDAPDYDSRTALHLAAAEGQLLSVYYLIYRCDADVNTRDRWGSTPLRDALRNNQVAIAKLLWTCEGDLGDNPAPELVQMLAELQSSPATPSLGMVRQQVAKLLHSVEDRRNPQLGLATTANLKIHVGAVIETIKHLGQLQRGAYSLLDTLRTLLEALQPLRKLLEVIHPRYDSVLRKSFDKGRARNARIASIRAASTSGPALASLFPALTDPTQQLRVTPAMSKGLRQVRDAHGGTAWKTTSKATQEARKSADGQLSFNRVLLQFGVMEESASELHTVLCEVGQQPPQTVLRALCMRLGVDLSPDQERQLLETVVVPHPPSPPSSIPPSVSATPARRSTSQQELPLSRQGSRQGSFQGSPGALQRSAGGGGSGALLRADAASGSGSLGGGNLGQALSSAAEGFVGSGSWQRRPSQLLVDLDGPASLAYASGGSADLGWVPPTPMPGAAAAAAGTAGVQPGGAGVSQALVAAAPSANRPGPPAVNPWRPSLPGVVEHEISRPLQPDEGAPLLHLEGVHLGDRMPRDSAYDDDGELQGVRNDVGPMYQGMVSLPHLLTSHVFEEVLQLHTTPESDDRNMLEKDLVNGVARTITTLDQLFTMLDLDKNGFVELSDLHRMQDDLGELGLAILEKAYGRFDTQKRGSLDRLQFVQALLLWLGVGEEEDVSPPAADDASLLQLQHTLSLNSWPSSNSMSVAGGQTLTGGRHAPLAKLLTVSDSGRARISPLVDRFRKAKEASEKSQLSRQLSGRLVQLEAMFQEVDANANGFIESRELERMLNCLLHDGSHVSKADVRAVMESIDANGDRRVSFDEFIKVILPMLEAQEVSGEEGVLQQQVLADMRPEGVHVARKHVLVLLPNSKYLRVWDAAIRWLAVYFYVTVPMDISFRCLERLSRWYYIATHVLDALLILDIGLHFFRAYTNKKSVLVTDPPRIRRNYLGKYFVADFVAACPYDLLVKSAGGSLRYQAFLRLPKLLRLHRVYVWYKKKESEIDADSMSSRLRVLAPIILGCTHLLACCWWYLGTYSLPNIWDQAYHTTTNGTITNKTVAQFATVTIVEKFNMTAYEQQLRAHWIGNYEGFGVQDVYAHGTIWEQYLLCFYWVVATITTNGQVGNMLPKNMPEILFTCVVMIVSVTLFAYLLAEISDKVMAQDAALVRMRSKVQGVQKFVSSRRLPDHLKSDITSFMESSSLLRGPAAGGAEGDVGEAEPDVFSQCSHTLQVDVAKHMSRSLISLVHIFEGCNNNFLDSLSVLLHEVSLSPDSYVFRTNDVSRELYIIASGAVELRVEHEVQGETVESLRSAGQVVGEMGFFFGMRHITHARVPSSCPVTLFALRKADYSQLVKLYPDQEEQITKNILQGWDVQRSMHSEVKRVLEVAKKKKRNERVVRLVDAAARGDIDEVNFMLGNNDVEVDDGDYHQRTALHLAASNGHIAMVRHLVLVHGANMNVTDRYNGTPIMDAVRHKHSEVVAFLKRSGARLNHDKAKGALFKAAVEGDAAYVELLINNGMDPNTSDYNQRTPLHLAASNGHLHIVQFLCAQPGIKLNPLDGNGNTPLMDAIRHNQLALQVALLAAGGHLGDVNVADKMCQAAAENDIDTLKVLHQNGVDVNAADFDQRTALHVAASRGRAEVAFYLLSLPGIDVNALDRWGATPLHDALLVGDKVLYALLERAGGLPADHPSMTEKAERQATKRAEEEVRRARDRVVRAVAASPEVGLLTKLAKDEMEAVLGKAVKHCITALEHMREVLRSAGSQRVLAAPMARMLCPQLFVAQEAVLACLDTLPGLLDRTMQLGRENEFYFEEWEKHTLLLQNSLQRQQQAESPGRHFHSTHRLMPSRQRRTGERSNSRPGTA
ncbi:hypothetical protein WJX72_002779 [[Myrmecia] bisecta]|uniref:Uncharacterized protein n=1 Tax=[Myrmecia] bisecta TaxID=41462 RepID=A0AAW1PD80_9CHLO